jgi:hypothetical protein
VLRVEGGRTLTELRSSQKGGKRPYDAAIVSTERAALLKLQREKLEHEFAVTKGEYMPKDEAQATMAELVRFIRDSVLAIPNNLIGVDRSTIRQVDDMVREILTEMAGGPHSATSQKGSRSASE